MLGADADPKDVTLPPPRERQWLIEQTALLLQRDGWRSYALAPLLEPTPTFFPDKWAGGERSVNRLLRRLLRYAGHDDLAIEVVVHDEDPARRGEVIGKPPAMRGHEPTAWVIPGPRKPGQPLRFAVEAIALREPENLVPALARAVASAHRLLVGLPTPEGIDGQRLIDLTGFALGFGLLTTDACQRFYARSDGSFRTTRAQSRLGALSVQDMSFLLALWAQARDLRGRDRRRLLARLQPNQAGFFREAQAWLEQLTPPVRARLGIPEPHTWPAPLDLAILTGPLEARADPPARPQPSDAPDTSGIYDDADDDVDDDEPEERRDVDRGIRNANRGKPVFRIERSAALRMAKILGFPVLMLGGLLSRGNFGVDVPMELVMPSAALLAVAGLAIGALFTDRRCSDPKCGQKLGVDDQSCPLCGGVIMGVIHNPKERLGAEEELLRAGKIDGDGLVVQPTADDEPDDEPDEPDDEPDEPKPDRSMLGGVGGDPDHDRGHPPSQDQPATTSRAS